MPLVNLANFPTLTAINLLSDPGHIGGPVVIPNAIKVMPVWILTDGKVARNVMYGSAPAGFTPTPALAEAAHAALIAGAGFSALAAFMPTTGQLARVELQDVRVANQPVIASTGAASPGTSASTALPSETAIVITIRTNLTGQANRGRIYIPNFASNAIGAGDTVAAPAVTALQNWTTNIFNAFAALGLTPSIGHPARLAYIGSTGTQHPARAAGLVPWSALLVRDNHWDSQRRRGMK